MFNVVALDPQVAQALDPVVSRAIAPILPTTPTPILPTLIVLRSVQSDPTSPRSPANHVVALGLDLLALLKNTQVLA